MDEKMFDMIKKISTVKNLVKRLCDKYELPHLEVKVSKNKIIAPAYFETFPYRVEFSLPTDEETIVHEFKHYIIHLIHIMRDVEEKLCENEISLGDSE